MRRILYSLSLLLLLSGCVPRYAMLRPHYEVDVRNPNGEPVSSATLWVRTLRSPPGYYPQPEQFPADAQGHISVEKKSHWEKIIFFMHGTNFYSWHWCIEAPGYAPLEGESEEIASPVVLQPARQAQRCPQAASDDLSSKQH